ncbi:hypothetical protein D3C87_755710 [compost metagenome]
MDLFSQLTDYNPPAPKVKVNNQPKVEMPVSKVLPVGNPELGYAILLEDIKSKMSPTIYGYQGDSCKVIANANGPLLVLEGKNGKFHVKREQVKL